MLKDFCHLAKNQSSILVTYVHKRAKAQCRLDVVLLAVDSFPVGNDGESKRDKFVHIVLYLYID